jgi:hypothetical protein
MLNVEQVIPSHWQKGALLDLRRYTDGSYLVTLAGEDIAEDRSNCITFDCGHDAQAFVSTWYSTSHQAILR